jgi:zinc transporter 2
MIQIDST